MTKPNNKFWQIHNLATNKGELLLYGNIASEKPWWDEGDTITPKQFIKDLKSLGDISELDVRINSPGGDVFAAHAIHSLLKAHKAQVNVYVDGIAASAATIITSAGDKVYIPTNAMMMVHDPMFAMMGYYNSKELAKCIDALEKIGESVIASYQAKTGKSKEELDTLMDAETWMTGEDAVNMGFADELLNAVEVAASINGSKLIINGLDFDISRFKNIPELPVIQAKATNQPKKEEPKLLTLDQLKNEHPDLYNQIMNEGREAGLQAERNRIKAIDELAMPGNEELINKAKFETGISAEQVAMEIIKAEKQRGTNFLAARKEDADPLNKVDGSTAPLKDEDEEKQRVQTVDNIVSGAKKMRGEDK